MMGQDIARRNKAREADLEQLERSGAWAQTSTRNQGGRRAGGGGAHVKGLFVPQ